MPRLPRTPYFWSAAFILWAAILWFLSSRTGDHRDLPSIPHIDKVAHFIYFAAGGAIVSAIIRTFRSPSPRRTAVIGFTVAIITLIGILDEYHQSFVPGRSGNDPFDLLADILGGLAGSMASPRLDPRLPR